MTDLAALVAAAPGSLVLPAGDRRASVQVPEPLRLLDSCDLGSARYIGVVEDSEGGRWTVPLVVDASGVRRALPGDGVAEALARGKAHGLDAVQRRTAIDARLAQAKHVQVGSVEDEDRVWHCVPDKTRGRRIATGQRRAL